jgi:hypothetical protein
LDNPGVTSIGYTYISITNNNRYKNISTKGDVIRGVTKGVDLLPRALVCNYDDTFLTLKASKLNLNKNK